MKKLLLILLCLPMIGLGQGWEKMFGGTDDDGHSVQQTTERTYISLKQMVMEILAQHSTYQHHLQK